MHYTLFLCQIQKQYGGMNVNNKISVFGGYNKPVPIEMEMTVKSFAEYIKFNDEYLPELTAIRNETDPKKKKYKKSKLPCVSISGTLSYRNNDSLIEHSGFMSIDIDKDHNPKIKDYAVLRDSLSGIENIYFSALSASGKGVFLIIPISNPDQHLNHFKALEIDFKNLGIVIDTGCKDVSRLRGISYDPDAIINPEAKTYRRIYQPPKPKQYTHSTHSPEIKKLAEWAATKAPFVNGSRHEFIKQLAGACHRFGISESETRGELLRYQQTDFTEKEIEKIINWTYANAQYYGVSVHKGR